MKVVGLLFVVDKNRDPVFSIDNSKPQLQLRGYMYGVKKRLHFNPTSTLRHRNLKNRERILYIAESRRILQARYVVSGT